MREIKVPDIGGIRVPIIELLVKVGDSVAIDTPLITLESDKASMEVPSTHAGIIKEILVKLGDTVQEGDAVVKLEEAQSIQTTQTVQAQQTPATPTISKPVEIAVTSTQTVAQNTKSLQTNTFNLANTVNNTLPADITSSVNLDDTIYHASPSVRKLARELGLHLKRVTGTGLKNRITDEDLKSFIKQALQTGSNNSTNNSTAQANTSLAGLLPWPEVDFSKFGQTQSKPLSRIKKLSGANLHRNWVMIPHVTNHEQADITELEKFRVQLNKEYEKQGIKITMLAFLIKAAVAALKQFPNFNSSLQGDDLVLKQYFNIGFAADTPNGLVVPVIKQADQKGIVELAQEMAELAKLARDGKLKPDQMQGGCFSISSLGGIGGTYFTPIINAPEVAIMGVCKASYQPIYNGKDFEARLILPMSLSWDHRVIDGAEAARFNTYFAQVLADFRRITL